MNTDYKSLFDTKRIDKQFRIYTDDQQTVITNSLLFNSEFELNESLCSEETIRYGTCEASSITFTAANSFTSLKGKWLNVDIYVGDEETPFRLGRYKVDTDKPTAHRVQRQVTAYDAMYDLINADVTKWYLELWNNVTVSLTVKEFRDLFFRHFGITQDDVTLINDNFVFYQSADDSQTISGKDCLNAICEINGVFGHIGRDNKFHYVSVETGSTYAIANSEQISADFEEFTTGLIDAISVYDGSGKVIAHIGSNFPTNEYDLSGLFITADHLTGLDTALSNLYNKIHSISYRPFDGEFSGNPCYEVGDKISFTDKSSTISTVLLERRMTGIQGLRDTFSAKGKENRDKNINSNTYNRRSVSEQIETIKQELKDETSKIYIIKNYYNVLVEDNDTNVEILSIPFVIANTDAISFDIEIDMEIETTEVEGGTSDEYDQYNDAVGQITYILNGEDLGIYPKETWQDGKHILTLHLAFPQVSSMLHQLSVYLKMNGGSCSIPALGATAILTGNGLPYGNKWNGVIEVRDSIYALSIPEAEQLSFAEIYEDVDVDEISVSRGIGNDAVPSLKVNSPRTNMLKAYSESFVIETEEE